MTRPFAEVFEAVRQLTEAQVLACQATLGDISDITGFRTGRSVRCGCCGAVSTTAPYLYTLKHNRIPDPAYAPLLKVVRTECPHTYSADLPCWDYTERDSRGRFLPQGKRIRVRVRTPKYLTHAH